MTRRPAVRTRGISKTYGDVLALDQVDLDVVEGQIHGLVGPNGAGKTTLLGLLLGLVRPDRGELEILGTPIGGTTQVPEAVAGFVDHPGLYPSLTTRQNLVALARLRGLHLGVVDGALGEVGLSEVADEAVRGFSLGMRQRAGLAAALLTRPRLLVLDEPSNGLDPRGARDVARILTGLADAGTAIVLSSHRMDDLSSFCSEISILTAGRVVFTGPVAKLAAESGALDYRLRVSDAPAAGRVIAQTPGLTRVDDPATNEPDRHPDTVVLRGPEPAVEDLVARLVLAGIGVRSLAPVMTPLEAAFLALTDRDPPTDVDPGRGTR